MVTRGNKTFWAGSHRLLKDFGVPVSRSEKLAYARDHLNEIFGHKFPCRFRPDDISYEKEKSRCV